MEVKSQGWNFTRVKNRALEDTELSTIEKLVYVGLSYFADQQGRCYPSHAKLAEITGASKSSVIRAIESLVSRGYLGRENRSDMGVKQTNIYTVLEGVVSQGHQGSVSVTPGVVSQGHQGSVTVTHKREPINESQLNESNVRTAYTQDFEALWVEYPRKVEKKKAMKAYQARRKEGVKHDDLLTSVENYRKKVTGSEPRFIKHGSTFLGPDEVWKDYLEAEEVVDLVAERVKKRFGV